MNNTTAGAQLTTFKKEVSFIDANRNKALIEIELTHRNGYDELTLSGDYANGGGQVQDNIAHLRTFNSCRFP